MKRKYHLSTKLTAHSGHNMNPARIMLKKISGIYIRKYCSKILLLSQFIASEASFLVCSMARIFSIYIGLYISGRTSCRKCSKCFYVYLNIRPVRYSARIESVDKPVFFSTAKKCSATEDCCRNPGGDRRPSSTVKYCSETGLMLNRQRGERPGVNGLPFSHRRKETPVFNNLELLVNRRLRQNRRKRDKPVFNS